MRTTRFATSLVFSLVLVYAIVRYVVVGTVAPSQLPVFILNKALAVASLVLVALALAIGPLVRLRAIKAAWMKHRKELGLHGFVLGMLHAVLTIATLSPASYGKLYSAGALTLNGGIAVLAGVLTAFALIVPAITSATLVRQSMSADTWRRAQRLGIVALAIGVGHVAVLGWRSWLAPGTWPGGLPPLTAIAVVSGIAAFAIRGAAIAARAAQHVPLPRRGHSQSLPQFE
jgi:DMSO/TMAO reductase YedYZ heme-binding membrane subunit